MATINSIGSNKPIEVAFGGTADATLTLNGILFGNTTSAVGVTAAGTTGQVLTATTGSAPTWQAAGGGGITTINGDTGSVTGATVSIKGASTAGATVVFTGSGTAMTLASTDASNNIFIGTSAGNNTLSGYNNQGIGLQSLRIVTTGNQNAGFGTQTFFQLTTGTQNSTFGSASLNTFTTGSNNSAFGFQAGSNYTAAESSNILIGSLVNGTAGESNVLRIGAGTGTGAGQLAASFISGIFGKTVGVITGVPVVIDNTDQLGTVVSSIRFKENVQPLNDSKVLDLQPVSFNYKENGHKSIGLIAEEVEKVLPEMVVYDKDGLPLTVRYLDLPILLLAEIKKLRQEVNELKFGGK